MPPPPQEKWKTRSLGADWAEERDRARGRGALSNASGRFEKQYAEPFDDGWGDEEEKPATIKTETIVERPKTIITYNTSPDISFSRTINPYKGCEHGCIYCYARPNHTYRGLSAGIDFETRLFYKENAGKLLEEELGRSLSDEQVAELRTVGDLLAALEQPASTTPPAPLTRWPR